LKIPQSHWTVSPRSILVIRTGHLGDTIGAIPALRMIRAWAPQARLEVLCDQPLGGQTAASTVLEPTGVADRIHVYSARPWWRAFLQFRHIVMQVRPDLAIVLGQSRASAAAVTRLVTVLRMLGIADVRCSNPISPEGGPWLGESERLCSGLRSAGIEGPTPPFAIPLCQDARLSVQRRLAELGVGSADRYLVFCGGGKAPTQRWPLERYAEVLDRIVQASGWPVVAIGSAQEIQQYRAAFGNARPGIVCLRGLDIPQLFELMRGATAYLGNDTGPTHVAAAVSCPVVAVMSARNAPGQWYPEVEPRLVFRKEVSCQNCFLQDCVTEQHRCMTGIAVEEVAAGILPFLDRLRAANAPFTRETD
jgi:ADP-heptose:LPS heptosyltransferase